MVFGGFHLMDKTDKEMDAIIAGMKSLGVVKCGAKHFTGEIIRQAFGGCCFELGTGNRLIIQ
jgi:7,8-dihydropterin-6-yl-methyl-4-(beta-D-ribofuranosyl)aminobenzene 5'-phosphate synthase